MSPYKGTTPVELFGLTEFPEVGDAPYFLTLGPHAFYWFALEPRGVESDAPERAPEPASVPELSALISGNGLFSSVGRGALETALPKYLRSRRWFGGKGRQIQSVEMIDAIDMPPNGGPEAHLVLVKLSYVEGEPETYLITVASAVGEDAEQVARDMPNSIIARVKRRPDEPAGVLYEAINDKHFAAALLESIGRRRRLKGSAGEIATSPTEVFRRLRGGPDANIDPSPLTGDQTNSSVVYGDKLILKLFRRPDEGVNPDLEIGRVLTEETPAVQVPSVAGYIEYRRHRRESMTLGVLQSYVPNEGDAWNYTLDNVGSYLERVLSTGGDVGPAADRLPSDDLLDLARRDVPEEVRDLVGTYTQSVGLLGQRTAELHLALASSGASAGFAPEPFTGLHQRSLYQSTRGLMASVFPALQRKVDSLQNGIREEARTVLDLEPQVLRRFQSILEGQLTGMRIRCHGDYHLGQVLFTGKDFVIIDFEGEPTRPLSQRRLKRSPLKDVAGMLRSFHYAAYSALFNQAARGIVPAMRLPNMEAWAGVWYRWVGAAFLREYLHAMGDSPILPRRQDELSKLLGVLVLEKAVYEVDYELNNRPDWLRIPLRGVIQEINHH